MNGPRKVLGEILLALCFITHPPPPPPPPQSHILHLNKWYRHHPEISRLLQTHSLLSLTILHHNQSILKSLNLSTSLYLHRHQLGLSYPQLTLGSWPPNCPISGLRSTQQPELSFKDLIQILSLFCFKLFSSGQCNLR